MKYEHHKTIKIKRIYKNNRDKIKSVCNQNLAEKERRIFELRQHMVKCFFFSGYFFYYF